MKAVRWTNRRPYPPHQTTGWLKYLPGCALALLCVAVPLKDSFYFNNGTGGADWKIGKPAVTVWDAHQPRSLTELRGFALQLINRDRQLNGLQPLVLDPLLSQAAQLHAEDMKRRNYYDHLTPEGKTPSDRFAAVGGQGGVGENIMLQTGSLGSSALLNRGLVENFQKSWMYSDGHRVNLLTLYYSRVGYGIVADPVSGKIYAVQKFQ